jgi:formyl-CoA transferase
MVLINTPTQDQWNRLCGVMGRPDLITDDRFSTPLARQEPAARDAIEALCEAWMATQTVEGAYGALVAADVPAAPVRPLDRVADDPQLQHRRMIQEVRHPATGLTLRLTGNPIKVSELPDEIGHPAYPGEHNGEIYGGWLGLDEGTLADLAARKVI